MAPTPDPSSVLQRVLLLERQQGFANRAAVGGLTAFAHIQAERANGRSTAGLLAAVRALDGYADADRHGRERAVASALQALLTGAPPPAQSATSRVGREVHTPDRKSEPATAVVPPVRRTRPRLTVVHGPEDLELS